MTRRRSFLGTITSAVLLLPDWALAQKLSLSSPLTDAEAEAGMRLTLERVAVIAVKQLGRNEAFMGNPKARIGLPKGFEEVAQDMLANGQRRTIGELVTAMNRTAEGAAPEAGPLLLEALRSMPIENATKVLAAGDRSATRYFEHHARSVVAEAFTPAVQRSAERALLARKYDNFAAQSTTPGLLKADNAGLDRYIARKTLDNLFVVMGDAEARIRADPVGTTGSPFLGRVFKSLP